MLAIIGMIVVIVGLIILGPVITGMLAIIIGLIALGPIGWVILGFLLICIAIAKSKNNKGIDTPNELYSQKNQKYIKYKIKQNDRWLELEFTLKMA